MLYRQGVPGCRGVGCRAGSDVAVTVVVVVVVVVVLACNQLYSTRYTEA